VLGTATQGVICATPPRRRRPGSRPPTRARSRSPRRPRSTRPTVRARPRRCLACPTGFTRVNGRCIGAVGASSRCPRNMITVRPGTANFGVTCACSTAVLPRTSRCTSCPATFTQVNGRCIGPLPGTNATCPRPLIRLRAGSAGFGVTCGCRPRGPSRAPTRRIRTARPSRARVGVCPRGWTTMAMGGCRAPMGTTRCPRRGDFKMVVAATALSGVVCFVLPNCPTTGTGANFQGWVRLPLGRCRAPIGIQTCPAGWALSAWPTSRRGVTCMPCLAGVCPPPPVRRTPRPTTVSPTARRTASPTTSPNQRSAFPTTLRFVLSPSSSLFLFALLLSSFCFLASHPLSPHEINQTLCQAHR